MSPSVIDYAEFCRFCRIRTNRKCGSDSGNQKGPPVWLCLGFVSCIHHWQPVKNTKFKTNGSEYFLHISKAVLKPGEPLDPWVLCIIAPSCHDSNFTPLSCSYRLILHPVNKTCAHLPGPHTLFVQTSFSSAQVHFHTKHPQLVSHKL